MGDTTAITSLGELIAAIYDYSLQIVGLCVFGMFLYAGFQVMFGNRSAAVEIIKNAVIGAILLFSAVTILEAINPDLAGQEPEQIPSLRTR